MVEQYKQTVKKSTKKTKGLRKGLKHMTDEMKCTQSGMPGSKISM